MTFGPARVLRGLAFIVLVAVGNADSAVADQTRAIEAGNLERNKALVRQWIEEGFNKHDANVVDRVFADDVTVNGTRVGRSGLKESMQRRFNAFPDLYVTLVAVVAEGDQVGIWYTGRGTHRGDFEGIRATGKRVTWSGADLLRIRSGRIVEAWFVDDSLGLLRQLGATVTPSPK